MKTILTQIALAVALIAPGWLHAQDQKPAEDPAHQELRQLRDGLLAAMNSGEIEGSLPFLHTNCVITWHNAEVSRGHAGVRAYFNRVITGPDRLVDSFRCEIKVEELTILHGGDTGVCFGSSDEQFKLKNGKNLQVKGRWSATLVKENGRWLVANMHASTNLFDNVLLALARKAALLTGLLCLIAGLVLGWFAGWRRRRA